MQLLEHCQTKGFSAIQIGPIAARGVVYLDPSDQKLIEMVTSGKLSRREIAILTNVPIQTVSRRVIRLMARLHDPLVVALIDHGQLLPEMYRDVGLAYFLRRWNVKLVRQHYGVSEYQFRRMLTYIRGWHAARRSSAK